MTKAYALPKFSVRWFITKLSFSGCFRKSATLWPVPCAVWRTMRRRFPPASTPFHTRAVLPLRVVSVLH